MMAVDNETGTEEATAHVDVEVPTEAPTGVTFITRLEVVRDIAGLANVVSKGQEARPILEGIYITGSAGTMTDPPKLVSVATDSYMLARITHEVPNVTEIPGGLAVLVEASGVVAFVKAVGARVPATMPVSWTITETETAVRLAAMGVEMRVRIIPGEFPKHERLWPTEDPELSPATIAITPDKLKHLAASVPRQGAPASEMARIPLHLEFHGTTHPIVCRVTSRGWEGLLMPVRT